MNHFLVFPVFFAIFACICTLPPPNGVNLPFGAVEWKNCSMPNEFYDCGSPCQRTCATLNEPCLIASFKCGDDCYCLEGYARDTKGQCIPDKDCPPKEIGHQ